MQSHRRQKWWGQATGPRSRRSCREIFLMDQPARLPSRRVGSRSGNALRHPGDCASGPVDVAPGTGHAGMDCPLRLERLPFSSTGRPATPWKSCRPLFSSSNARGLSAISGMLTRIGICNTAAASSSLAKRRLKILSHKRRRQTCQQALRQCRSGSSCDRVGGMGLPGKFALSRIV